MKASVQKQFEMTMQKNSSFEQMDEWLHAYFSEAASPHRLPVIGKMLNPAIFLLSEKKAQKWIESLLKEEWMIPNLFALELLEQYDLEFERANERIRSFFQEKNGFSVIFRFLKANEHITYAQFLALVFDKPVEKFEKESGLVEIFCFKVNRKMFVQPVFAEQKFANIRFACKKMASIFVYYRLENISQPIMLLKMFMRQLKECMSNANAALVMNELTSIIDYTNRKSLTLKQVHLLNLFVQFNGGKRALLRIEKRIDYLQEQYSNEPFMLSELEHTLIDYLMFIRAENLQLADERLHYGKRLIVDNRLNEFAVEMYLAMEDSLHQLRPTPNSLVKLYPSYFLEFIYAKMLQTFVDAELFDESYYILKNYEIASCNAIFHVLNGDVSEEALAQIEATVQRDIIYIIKYPAGQMMEAIQLWKDEYLNEKSPFYPIAMHSAGHVINILKTLFVKEELDCFEKLFEVYKKYFNFPEHTLLLHNFLIRHIDEKTSQNC